MAYKCFLWMFLLFTAPSWAFDVHGIASGISTRELIAAAQLKGLQARGNQNTGFWIVTDPGTDNIRASLSFCKNSLFAINENMDYDADFFPTVTALLTKYGNPAVKSGQVPVADSNQFLPNVTMVWYNGVDRITLSLTPESRDGKGNLRFNRSASITHFTKNSCITDF